MEELEEKKEEKEEKEQEIEGEEKESLWVLDCDSTSNRKHGFMDEKERRKHDLCSHDCTVKPRYSAFQETGQNYFFIQRFLLLPTYK